MIELKMELIPYGSRSLAPANIIKATFFSYKTDHCYVIYGPTGESIVDGKVPKTHSGHRNPLHLLKDILNDIDLDALGEDYVKTDYDK